MKKYVCSVKLFPNCRVHDGGSDHGLWFFDSAEDLKRELRISYNDYEMGDIYSAKTGAKVATVTYEFRRHDFRKIELSRTQEFLPEEDNFESGVLADDGEGVKKWFTWDEYRRLG